MKYIITFLILTSAILAQSADKNIIKSSNQYYYGEASSENEKEAQDAALSILTQQIAVTVQSSFEHNVQEGNGNIKETVNNIINTYSGATLRNVKTITSNNGNTIEVFRYIEKSEVKKIFNERVQLIKEIYKKALEFENEGNIGYALKEYYFAIILINSVPEPNFNFEGKDLKVEIPDRINDLISGAQFQLKSDKMVSDNEREITFGINVKGVPVRSLEFSFWDGTNQVNVAATDGEGVFRLVGSSVKFDKLDVSIKYSYYESRDEIKEVSELWNNIVRPSFKNTKQVMLFAKPEKLQVAENKELSAGLTNRETNSFLNTKVIDTTTVCNVTGEIRNEADCFLNFIKKKNIAGVREYYKNDPFLRDKIVNIMNYNNLKVVESGKDAEINKTLEGWELRKIKVICNYSTLHKQAPEYIILDFNEAGKLNDLNFGITEGLYDNFVKQGMAGNDWGNRQVIIKFIEKYRTAYLSRNVEMLDSLFADDAVIIVGRVLKKAQLKDSPKYIKLNDAQPDFRQIRYSKDQYLKGQKRLFNNQKDLFLGYSTFKINKKNTQAGVYGISMRQDYNSTSYSDEGYLFLLIDFEQTQPQIYIRSWQPSEWNENALIKLSNFNLNK